MKKIFGSFSCSSRKQNDQNGKIHKSFSLSLDISRISPIFVESKEKSEKSKRRELDNFSEFSKSQSIEIIYESKSVKQISLMKKEDRIFLERIKMAFSDFFDPRFSYERYIIMNDMFFMSTLQRKIFVVTMIDYLNQIKTGSQFLISQTWLDRLKFYLLDDFDEPGPVYNDDFFMDLIPRDLSCLKVNEYLWRFLVLCYGGGPELSFQRGSSRCLDLIKVSGQIEVDEKMNQKILKIANSTNLKKRKELENDFMREESDKCTKTLYLVDKEWLDGYKEYLFESNTEKYIPLKNKKLLNSLSNSKEAQNTYSIVNERTWQLFSQLYLADCSIPVIPSTIFEHVADVDPWISELKKIFTRKESVNTLENFPLHKISSITQKLLAERIKIL